MNQTVLVTGASRGIGKAIALQFAKEGYHIVITCKNSDKELMDTKKQIEAYNVMCEAFVGDMGDYSTILRLKALITEKFGVLSILVNNAGISYVGLFTDMTPDEWQAVIQTNLTSVYNCCHAFLPSMLHQKSGKIINISSVWGVVGASCEVAYSASKGGMNAFTKALAKEVAPSNIQVNAIACGAIDTQMNQLFTDEERRALQEEIPADRMGLPQEVALLTYQLVTGPAYLNGQVITLDGAWI